jgi:serine/threonine protein kinase
LHTRGIVYGDLSPNNCFVGTGDHPKIAIIDPDNLRYEQITGGQTVYTPGYGAPEVVQGRDCSRPRADIWSFAVLAFDSLALLHPFNGMLFEALESEEPGWDLSTPTYPDSSSPTEHVHKGLLPFIDDSHDDSNRSIGGIDRNLILSIELKVLFQEALGDGRLKPWRRPSLIFFARELFRAHDKSIVCPDCRMSYFVGNTLCPYCECEVPRHVVLSTDKWEMVCQNFDGPVEIPNRLCTTFSAVSGNRTICEAVIDFEAQLMTRARGSEPIPAGVSVRFQRGNDEV